MDAAGGGALGDTGKSLWGMDRKWPGGSSVNKRIKVETDSVAGGTLHTPTGDTGIHFLWNVSGIPGNCSASTTSLASRGTHPVTTGVWVVGTCTPAGQLGRGLTPERDITSWVKSIHSSAYELLRDLFILWYFIESTASFPIYITIKTVRLDIVSIMSLLK